MINKTNTNKKKLKLIVFRDNNGRVCLKENNFNFESNKLIGFKELNAEDLINETETEAFTIEERTDLNIKKIVGK